MTVSGKKFMDAVRQQRRRARKKAAAAVATIDPTQPKLCRTSPTHGVAVHGKRCQVCWDQKLAGEREIRRIAREAKAAKAKAA